ncbi:MAG: hypothetical protein KJ041_00870 [Gammaproteobacteria bacterium]|nr:hypothetical protein [Gammaproteobacteria bacterium]
MTVLRPSFHRLLLALLCLLPVLALAAPVAAGPDKALLDRARGTQLRHQVALLVREGVVGVGIGMRPSGQPTIRVLLARQDVQGIPGTLDEFIVEQEVTGRLRSGQLAAQDGPIVTTVRWPRPVPIGVSTAHRDVTAGSIGCLVWQSDGCHTSTYILSNNHVIANRNNALPGDPVLQPGPFDGGTVANDTVAWMYQYEPINFSASASNLMDAAIASTATHLSRADTPADGYGLPKVTPLNPTLGLAVMKYGRTTRLTQGTITGVNFTLSVDYPEGTARFVNQVIINGDNGAPFSSGGDSGSLVVASSGPRQRRPVGLLFAGGGSVSAASPIGPILSRFAVNISGE